MVPCQTEFGSVFAGRTSRTPRASWPRMGEVPRNAWKYHQRRLETIHEEPFGPSPKLMDACPAEAHYGHGWQRSDGSEITIGADCAGIGSSIQAVTDIAAKSRVEFICELCDGARGICQAFAQPHAAHIDLT